jgi:hypothetical protein
MQRERNFYMFAKNQPKAKIELIVLETVFCYPDFSDTWPAQQIRKA